MQRQSLLWRGGKKKVKAKNTGVVRHSQGKCHCTLEACCSPRSISRLFGKGCSVYLKEAVLALIAKLAVDIVDLLC